MLNIWIDSFSRAAGVAYTPNTKAFAPGSGRAGQDTGGIAKTVKAWLAARREKANANRVVARVGRMDARTLADIGVVQGPITEMRRAANTNVRPEYWAA